LNLTRLHLGIAHESQFQGLGISRVSFWLISWRSFLQSDRSILLECRIPATNRETLARFSPQTAKPESLRRSTPETGVR
jgi:hypothetical protein